MVVRLHNTDRWTRWEAGKLLELPGTEMRVIRLEVNTAEPTRFDVIENGVITLLGVSYGLETYEFTAGANTVISQQNASGDDVFYYTADGESVSFETVEPTFTKIATRRERNPELERILMIQQQNFDRRLAKQAEDIARFEARMAEQAAALAAAQAAASAEAKSGDGEGAAGETAGAGEAAAGGDTSQSSAGA